MSGPGAGGAGRLAPVAVQLRAAGCVFAEEEAALLLEAAADDADLERLVGRRVAGEPLEHLLGWAGFAGLRLAVGPGVFVPRARTELLVEEAERLLAARPGAWASAAAPVVVDLCCGCGAVAAALLARRGRGLPEALEVHAADVDPVAVRFARRNVEPAGGAVHRGDLYEALPGRLRGRIDVLVVNAPYVPTAAIALMPPEARLHEPRTALDGGTDGLDVQRRVAAEAPGWLVPGGTVLVESGVAQATGSAALLEGAGLVARVVTDPERDATAVRATRPPLRARPA